MAFDVVPVTPDRFEAVLPLLERFENTHMRPEDWRRMLFDLPWEVEEPHRGFMLVEGATVAGFMGTIFSRRMIGGTERRFCNLSSWIVSESHRHATLALLRPVDAMRDYTILALTSSPAAQALYLRMGFRTLETAHLMVPPFARAGRLLWRGGGSVTTRLDRIRAALEAPGRRIVDDMAGTHAAQALVRDGDRRCHIVATRSPSRAGMRVAYVQYASDWELFWDWVAPVSAAFSARFGTIGLRVDARHLRGPMPRFATRRLLPRPNLFRPAEPGITPAAVDGLYTELVGHRW